MNKFIIFNFSVLWIFLNLFIGFIVFLMLIKDNYSREVIIDPNSKFIVVATGGSNRILEGINILKKYGNMKMLITGVGEGITKSDIARAISASKKEIQLMLNLCIKNLDEINFFRPKEKRPKKLENLRNIFYKMDLSDKETRILSGVFASLGKKR